MTKKNIETVKKKDIREMYQSIGWDVFEEADQYPIDKLNLLCTENNGRKIYNRCTENVFRILTNHPDFKGRFRYDHWRQKADIKLKDNKWKEIVDAHYVPIQRRISAMYPQFRNVGKDMVIDAINDAAGENAYDAAEQYIRSTTWDKKDRLTSWLHKVYGVPKDKYHSAVGENFFKGMAKRIIDAGCKFDTVMILEGSQGVGKSTSLRIIAGDEWYLETTLSANDKDFFLQFKGKLIVEFSEGETLSRTETKRMKGIISTQVDTYRAPYGRNMQDIPRRCIFAMTTNNDEYLKDETGNRRFLPIEVKKVDFEWLRKNKDQLYAEALHRVEELKESVWEYPAEAAQHQAAKMVRSSFEEAISEWLNNPVIGNGKAMDLDNGVGIDDVWKYALGGERSRFHRKEQMEIATALRACGYEKERRQIDGIKKWRWYEIDGGTQGGT